MASADGLVVALLAAGRSIRFGDENKLLATLGGQPLIAWAAKAGRTLEARRHLLIGPEPDPGSPLAGYDCLPNPHPERGMASSLRIAALAASDVGASALLVLLADMPFVTPGHLGLVLSAHATEPERPIFSEADGTPQPPALFPSTFFPDLLALDGDAGARGLARTARWIAASTDSLLDIDTPADLERARRLISG